MRRCPSAAAWCRPVRPQRSADSRSTPLRWISSSYNHAILNSTVRCPRRHSGNYCHWLQQSRLEEKLFIYSGLQKFCSLIKYKNKCYPDASRRQALCPAPSSRRLHVLIVVTLCGRVQPPQLERLLILLRIARSVLATDNRQTDGQQRRLLLHYIRFKSLPNKRTQLVQDCTLSTQSFSIIALYIIVLMCYSIFTYQTVTSRKCDINIIVKAPFHYVDGA